MTTLQGRPRAKPSEDAATLIGVLLLKIRTGSLSEIEESIDRLSKVLSAFDVPDCRCPRKEKYDSIADAFHTAPCQHVIDAAENFPLEFSEWLDLLHEHFPEEYEDRPPAPLGLTGYHGLLRAERVAEMARRQSLDQGLYHPDDIDVGDDDKVSRKANQIRGDAGLTQLRIFDPDEHEDDGPDAIAV